MGLIKVLGLAAVAAFAAMAFIGAGSAFAAEKDSVVICDQLVEKGKLCPEGHLWPKGAIVLALSTEVVFSAGSLEQTCPHSTLEASTTAESGLSLPLTITNLTFGTLSNGLGVGCEWSICDEIHTKTAVGGTYAAQITVTGVDEFHLKWSGSWQLLHCFGFTCEYGSENILSLPITHDGKHPLHEGTNLPKITIHTTLTKSPGSPFVCPSSGEWETNFVVHLLHDPVSKKTGLGWPALDNPVIKF